MVIASASAQTRQEKWGRWSMSARNVRRWLLTVNSIVVIASTGCQTMTNRMAKESPQRAEASSQSTPTGMAKTDFRREISRDQQFNVHVELAKVHESQGNNDAALAEYQQAIEIGERRGSILTSGKLGPEPLSLAHRRIAATYDRMGKFTLAEAHYGKALKLTPNDPKVWNDAGYSYYLQNRLADAERTLKTAQTFAPNDTRILTNLGLTQAMAGKTQDALTTLGKAGGPATGHANLGFILAATGRTAEARKAYETALTLQPELAQARQALSRLDAQSSTAPLASLKGTAGRLDANVSAASATNQNPPATGASPTQQPASVGLLEGSPAATQAPASGAALSLEKSTTDSASSWIEPAGRTETAAPQPSPAVATTPSAPLQTTEASAASATNPAPSTISVSAEPTPMAQPTDSNPRIASAPIEPETAASMNPSPAQPMSPSQPTADSVGSSSQPIALTVVGDSGPVSEARPSEAIAATTPRSEPIADSGPEPTAATPDSPELAQETTPPAVPTPTESQPVAAVSPPAEAAPAPSAAEPAQTAAAPTPASDSIVATPAQAPTSPTAAATAAAGPANASPQSGAGSDLGDPFPAGMNELISKSPAPQAPTKSNPTSLLGSLPALPADEEATAPTATPQTNATAPSATSLPSQSVPSQRQRVVSGTPSDPRGDLPTTNPIYPNAQSPSAQPAAATNDGQVSDRTIAPGGVSPSYAVAPYSQQAMPLAAVRRIDSAPPAMPSKSTPSTTVPGWAVPKNYRNQTYPPTPSDFATRAPRKSTPTVRNANSVPATPW